MSIVILQGSKEKKQRIHYEVDTSLFLGKGGMGQVFKGSRVDEKTNVRTDVAVKFLFDDLPLDVIERARREACVQIDHENLLQMYSFIEIETESSMTKESVKRYHVASEYVNGVRLLDLINGEIANQYGQSVPEIEHWYKLYNTDRRVFAIRIIQEILNGVEALHKEGYIHRDLDPSNIMITVEGKVKIIDFGIAKKLNDINTQDRQLTVVGYFVGKVAYAAPELILGFPNNTTDIYAIGIILFQLLSGHLPFEGNDSEIMDKQKNVDVPIQNIPYVSLRKVIKKATAKNCSERYQTAADFLSALKKVTDNENSSWLKILVIVLIGLIIGSLIGLLSF